MDPQDYDDQITQALSSMVSQADTSDTLESIVELVTDTIENCHYAGVSLVHKDRIDTPAATDELLRRVDELQYSINEGPCLAAIREGHTVTSDDLAHDPRWPKWGPLIARELGIHASMSFRLFTTESHSLGALNAYSLAPYGFDHGDVLHGQTIAAHAGVALAARLKQNVMIDEVHNWKMIGQATGVLMERLHLDAESASELLRQSAQDNNVELPQVARHVVETRQLPPVFNQ
jgi:hypothetical protein